APLLPLPRRHGARAQRRRPPARLPAHAPLGAPLLALARRRVHGAGDTARRPDRARPARARAPDAAPRRRQGDLVAHLRGLLRALDARLHLPGQRARRLGDLPPRPAPAASREPEAPRPDALLRAPGGVARPRLRRRPPPTEAARRAERRTPCRAARDMTDGAAVAHDVHELADVVVVGSGAGGAVVARELAVRGRGVVLVEEGGFFTG